MLSETKDDALLVNILNLFNISLLYKKPQLNELRLYC